MFNLNQIVKGRVAGTFVILALRTVGGLPGAQVKPVNPADHAQVGAGEMFLPFSALMSVEARGHRNYNANDYTYFVGKGWTDAEIVARWNVEAGPCCWSDDDSKLRSVAGK